MKKGNKKNSIVDRAKSNIVKNRKKNINRLNKIYDFLNTFEGRFTTIVFFTIIGFIVITANLYKIQIIQGNKWRAAGEEKYSSKTYFLHSKDDFVVSFSDFLEFKNIFPKSNFIEFENKNHFLDLEFVEFEDLIKQKF